MTVTASSGRAPQCVCGAARTKAVACPVVRDDGQALLEQLGVVEGDLVVESGAGQGEDVDSGGRSLLPAWPPSGQRLGLGGAVAGCHRPTSASTSVPVPGQNKQATDGW
ncbi:MAG: hypothetical protein ACLPH5_15090 [Candidatus Sulfotelmatobacter sp.]